MPQQLYWVREKESGQTFQMHSVDAAEEVWPLATTRVIGDPRDVSAEGSPVRRRRAALDLSDPASRASRPLSSGPRPARPPKSKPTSPLAARTCLLLQACHQHRAPAAPAGPGTSRRPRPAPGTGARVSWRHLSSPGCDGQRSDAIIRYLLVA